MPHSKQTQEQMRNKIVDMYQSGKGYKAISKALGLQRTIVRVRGGARGGPRGLKPRMFSEKPECFYYCKKGPGWNDPMTAVVPRVKGFACLQSFLFTTQQEH